MTIEKLLEKARVFEKNNEVVTWKPKDFPEDMTEGSTLDELVSEGDYMYEALEEAVNLIHDLAIELEFCEGSSKCKYRNKFDHRIKKAISLTK